MGSSRYHIPESEQERQSLINYAGFVICSGCFRPEYLSIAMESVTVKDFEPGSIHKRVFQAIIELTNEGETITMVTLSAKLPELRAEICLLDPFVVLGEALYRADIRKLKEFSQKRQLQSLANKIGAWSSNGQAAAAVIEQATNSLARIADQTTLPDTGVMLNEAIIQSNEYQDKVDRGEIPPPLSTGFPSLDKITKLMPGEIFLIAGWTSQGKSAFAMNLTWHVAHTLKQRVVYITSEMSEIKIAHRFMSLGTQIPLWEFRYGHVRNVNDHPDGEAIRTAPIKIYYETNMNRIGSIVRAEKKKYPDLAFVVIDYLQRIRTGKDLQPRLEANALSRYFKDLAVETMLPVAVLSQLTRAQGDDKKKGRRPVLQDLKESGNLEEDADIVFMLWLREQLDTCKTLDKWHITGLIEKGRDVATGQIYLELNRPTITFKETDEPHGD